MFRNGMFPFMNAGYSRAERRVGLRGLPMFLLLSALVAPGAGFPGAWAGGTEVIASRGAATRALEGKEVARRCTTKTPPVEDRLGPVRNDSASEWCYAFLTADLLSWQLGQVVSAADVGIIYNDESGTRRPGQAHSAMDRGGRMTEAFDFMVRKGMCLEADMPSQDFLVSRGDGTGESYGLRGLLAEIEGATRRRDPARGGVPCSDWETARAMFPWLGYRDFADILARSSERDLINRLQERNCGGRRVFFPKPVGLLTVRGPLGSVYEPAVQDRLFERIDAELEAGGIVGVGLSAKFYSQGYSSRDFHAVSVVGRRYNPETRQCEYKVRDTSGEGCAGFQPCENGNLWASESSLRGRLYEIYLLR